MSQAPKLPAIASEADCTVVVNDELGGGLDDVEQEEQQGLSFDDALTKHVGEFGHGQILVYIAGSLLWVPNAVLILLLVFSLGSPVADRAWTCTAPTTDARCMQLLANTTDAAALTAGFCSLERSQWRWTHPPAGLVSGFDLVCADAYKAQLANTVFFVGYFVGSGLFGRLFDVVGRKRAAFGASAAAALFTAAAVGAPSFWVLMLLRLLTGIGVAGQALGAYLLATEMIGPSWRGWAGIITQVFFIVGEFALVLIALALPSWRGQFAAGAVACAASLLLWFVVPESGRWLQVQGRVEEAQASLAMLARLNGSRPPCEPLAVHASACGARSSRSALKRPDAEQQQSPCATTPSSSPAAQDARGQQQQTHGPPAAGAGGEGLGAALRNLHIARRFAVLAFAWCVMCMAYYGISFALGGLGGSLVLSFSVAALAELPSYLLAAYLIDHLGRHNTMAAGLVLGGLGCVGCGLTPPGTGQAVLAAVGKFGIAASFAVASVFTSELFPTSFRSAVLGYQNQAARLGGIIAPFIVMAGAAHGGDAGSLVPFLTFGGAALLAGALVFTLPETLGAPLPDTLQDMEALASVFTHKTWRTRGLGGAAKSMFKTHVTATTATAPGAAAARGGGGGKKAQQQKQQLKQLKQGAAGDISGAGSSSGSGGGGGSIPAVWPPGGDEEAGGAGSACFCDDGSGPVPTSPPPAYEEAARCQAVPIELVVSGSGARVGRAGSRQPLLPPAGNSSSSPAGVL